MSLHTSSHTTKQRLRAEMLTAQGDYRQALEDYKDALSSSPHHTMTYIIRIACDYFMTQRE